MFFYKIFGLVLASDLPFLQLVTCEATEHYDVLVERTELSEEIKEKGSVSRDEEMDALLAFLNKYLADK